MLKDDFNHSYWFDWYPHDSIGVNPTTPCETGEYYYLYDAVGNVIGVLEDGIRFYRWEIDAFGNSERIGGGMSGNNFLPMNQSGPKEHLTGKLYDTTTGLYYFHARWYDPLTGRFVSRDPISTGTSCGKNDIAQGIYQYDYILCLNNPVTYVDPDGEAVFDPNFPTDCQNALQDMLNRVIKYLRLRSDDCCQPVIDALALAKYEYESPPPNVKDKTGKRIMFPAWVDMPNTVKINTWGCDNLKQGRTPTYPWIPRCWLVHEAGHIIGGPGEPGDTWTALCGGPGCNTNIHQ